VSYGGAAVGGVTGWRLHPSHFAERHGLVIIIALGEEFIAIGIAATATGIGPGEVTAAILGIFVATSFWLAYFDFFSLRGERILVGLGGRDRVAFGRDAYTFAHLPMIAGIVLFAFAMKKLIPHVGDELDSPTAFALCGGSALYLLTFSAIRMRLERRLRVSRGRFVAAVALLLVLPLATAIPALAALAVVTAVWLALHAYELVVWREARADTRAALGSS
jgi:low temperature requirement protein LtrA